MAKSLALFPGQGSQRVTMGKALFDAFPLAKEIFQTADQALGFSLSKICFEGPDDKLTQTEVAQPAILTVSTICFELFRAKNDISQIAAAAGHSLGEYSALVAAGALEFKDAVVLVNKRGRYMQSAVPIGAGKMVAVLGKEVSELEDALSKITAGVAQIANVNSPGQVVVAGDVQGVDAFVASLGKAKIMPLQVSAPFHCALMKPAEEKLALDLDKINFKPAKFPVYSNYFAKPLSQPAEIREALKLQVCGRVRWLECMQKMIADLAPAACLEFGEGNVLNNMLKRINPDIARIQVGSAEEL